MSRRVEGLKGHFIVIMPLSSVVAVRVWADRVGRSTAIVSVVIFVVSLLLDREARRGYGDVFCFGEMPKASQRPVSIKTSLTSMP